jgi:hypothetical protein
VRARIRTGFLSFALGVLGLLPASSAWTRDGREMTWIRQASIGLDSRAADTLSRIQGSGRQLLALRAYLRAGGGLQRRWSWSQQDLVAYPSTPEGKVAAADIAAVESAFATANPGYVALANRMPRSLELQLSHWNDNESVASVAAALVASLEHQFPTDAASPNADQLRSALRDWTPPVAAPLAAPGLSAHGQGRAFDFRIDHKGKTVAGLDSASAHQQWDAAGWTRKLHAAVVASGRPFVGPLESPYEPWHYAYAPTGAQ